MPQPLCFVLMPFGKKPDPTGGDAIDFDQIYERAIRPAVEAAGLAPIRADEERTGGIIHKAMFERLLLCDYAVADLTCANANVFYELGVRHAVRPATTVVIFGKGHMPPFDVNYVRGLPYSLGAGNRFGDAEITSLRDTLTKQLQSVVAMNHKAPLVDSPLFQLITDYGAPDIARLKTDTFRERVEYAEDRKRELAAARAAKSRDALKEIETSLGDLTAIESGVLIDLFLSYRELKEFEDMVALYERLPPALKHAVLLREQLAMALNRLKRHDEALRVLEDVVQQRGPSSETCGLIGRVYKDKWEAAHKNNKQGAAGLLRKALAAYIRGFEADFRDAYPGINALTLLEIDGTDSARHAELLPVVEFAVKRRLATGKADYWDHATQLELAVHRSDAARAKRSLEDAVASEPVDWMRETTAQNLTYIRNARVARGQVEPWLDDMIVDLYPDLAKTFDGP
jgi:tetratricopeptide (TPR) repeat protein